MEEKINNAIYGLPYSLIVKNASDEKQVVSLFNHLSLYQKVNHKYVHIYSDFTDVSYKHLLSKIAHKNIHVGLIYIESKNFILPDHFEFIQIQIDANAESLTRIKKLPIINKTEDNKAGEVILTEILDSQTYWLLEMEPNTFFKLHIYPLKK